MRGHDGDDTKYANAGNYGNELTTRIFSFCDGCESFNADVHSMLLQVVDFYCIYRYVLLLSIVLLHIIPLMRSKNKLMLLR